MNKLIILTLAMLASQANAHPGGRDSKGGHTQSSTGKYHCHTDACRAGTTTPGYDRDSWPHWSDLDDDCQDTRAETLISGSSVAVTFKNGDKCKSVKTGKWFDPYTGLTFTASGDVDIDHRIALGEAHRMGGHAWTEAQKEAFANDSLNLIAVDDSTNQSKSDNSASEWMPPATGYWCEYIKTRDAVAAKHGLVFDAKELKFNKKIVSEHCEKP